jgi:glycosyltransferase involved in cell wall biosynthesis
LKSKILYVWQAKYPWDVRVEKVCHALKQSGFEVEILARQGAGEPPYAETEGPEKIPIHRVGPPGALSLPVPGNPLWLRAIRARIQKFKPDLVIARDIPLAIPAEKACREKNIPVIIDMAEHYPVAMRTWKKYQSHFFYRFLINTLKIPDQIESYSVRNSQGVMTVCEEQKERLSREFGFDPHQIVSILNTPEKEKIPNVLVPRKAAVFGYHGVVIQDRDLITVIRGFDLAAEQNAEIKLVISGGGESFEDVKKEIAQSKNRARISLTGPFKPTELPKLYSEIDFGIVSWKVNDFTNNTIANKFFDYAAYGKPILYTKTRPMENLMKTMQFGKGFEKEDPHAVSSAINELLQTDYETLSQNGRSAVLREYNWSEDTRKMVAFLNRFIQKKIP